MPAKSEKQRRAAGADIGRCAEGKKPKTFPTCDLAREFARKPTGKKSR